MSGKNGSNLNDVKNRFLVLPKSAVEGLEHEPKKSDFNIIKELGEGSFGTVNLVSHKKTKAVYALKAIDKSVPENIEQKANFNREVEIMYKLNHPNIVKLYGHFEDEKYCYFLMQYIPNKDLFELIPKYGAKPNIKLIASIMKDLLSAVYYLHNMKPTIIHRDIKPENILLDNNYKAYLTDFGWSNYMPNSFVKRTTVCGTPLYLPPEMIAKFGHDETADIWCIGILLFELVTGTTPFEGNDFETVATNICNITIKWPPNMDPDAKDLTSKILKFKGKERLPIEQILSHKFFTKYFPNAVKELIKPEHQKNRTFIISKDDPKKFETQTQTISSKLNNINEETNPFMKNNAKSDESNPFKKNDGRNEETNPFMKNSNRSNNAVTTNTFIKKDYRKVNTNNNVNNNYRSNNTASNTINNSRRGNNTSNININSNYKSNNTSNINSSYRSNNTSNTNSNYTYNNRTGKNNKPAIRATYVPKANIDLANSKNNNKISVSSNYNSNISNNRQSSNSYNKTYSTYNTNNNRRNSYKQTNTNAITISNSNNNSNNIRKSYKIPVTSSNNRNINSNSNSSYRINIDQNAKSNNSNNYNRQNNYKINISSNTNYRKTVKPNVQSKYASSYNLSHK